MSAKKPILFSGDMVLAILDGRKTQARWVIKPQPACDNGILTHPNLKDEHDFWLDEYGLTLRVTNVRAERLQDIGIYDIAAEGLDIDGLIAGFEIESDYGPGDNPDEFVDAARDRFSALWNSINAKRGFSWDSNPWVWVVEFEMVNE